jgi:hypothetical protein
LLFARPAVLNAARVSITISGLIKTLIVNSCDFS